MTPGSAVQRLLVRAAAIGRNRTRYSPPAESTSPAGVSSAAIRPPFKDRDAVAQFFHLVHEVTDQDDGDPAIARTFLIRSQVARLAPGSRPGSARRGTPPRGSPPGRAR